MTDKASQTVALTHEIGSWLRSTRMSDADLISTAAVDLADSLAAFESIQSDLKRLLSLDPSDPQRLDEVLDLASSIEVLVEGELKDHLLSLGKAWPKVVEHIGNLPTS